MKQQGRNKLPKEVRITLPPEIIRCIFWQTHCSQVWTAALAVGVAEMWWPLLQGQISPNALSSLQVNIVQTDRLRDTGASERWFAFIPRAYTHAVFYLCDTSFEILLRLQYSHLEFGQNASPLSSRECHTQQPSAAQQFCKGAQSH